jgi:hypothetical protein
MWKKWANFQIHMTHPKLYQVGIKHLNRSITHNEIEAPVKSVPKKKSPGSDRFSAEFYQNIKEEHHTNTPQTFP